MQLITKNVPEQQITIRNRRTLEPETVIIPATVRTYAPTLGIIHNWLFDDYGPFSLSWKDGWLCPFADRVHHMNITCSEGRRVNCPGVGLLIRPDLVSRLDAARQRRYTGRVICNEWSHILSIHYWDIPNEWLYTFPDDPPYVAFVILRHVLKSSQWMEWSQELPRRKNGLNRPRWLHPLNPRK